MTAASIARELGGRRSGAGFMARCPAHDDKNPSLSITERDGRLLVYCFSGCPQDAVVEALKGRGLWPEREKRAFSPVERRAWREQQARDVADLSAARWWRVAAEAIADEALDWLLGTHPERAGLARLVGALRGGDGVLLAQYRSWRQSWPELTAAMVHAGGASLRRRERGLATYIMSGMEPPVGRQSEMQMEDQNAA